MPHSALAGTEDGIHLGAYGLRFQGLSTAASSLTAVPADWPTLTVRRLAGTVEAFPFVVGAAHAEYCTYDQTGAVGAVRVTRDPLVVDFTSPGGFSDAALIHPDLGLVAAIANWWLDREIFHAGAFLTSTGAWGVLGMKEAGKSSLLAQLAIDGVGVAADDAVVLDHEGNVLAGPRCIDLRRSAAEWLGRGDDIGMVGARQRWRMPLPVVPSGVPLRGWIVPEWGEHIEVESVPPARRPQLLLESRYLTHLPYRPERLLTYMSLPFVRFTRPRRWDDAEKAVAALRDRVG